MINKKMKTKDRLVHNVEDLIVGKRNSFTYWFIVLFFFNSISRRRQNTNPSQSGGEPEERM